MIALGQSVPDFQLADLKNEPHALRDAHGSILVLVFWSAECPWSKRADEMIASWRQSWGQRVIVWMIASNRNERTEAMAEAAAEREVAPVLVDRDQQLAVLCSAETTPYCLVIDDVGRLRYRGAIDDITFRQREASQYYLKDAVDALLSGKTVNPTDTPGFGCTIVRMDPAALDPDATL